MSEPKDRRASERLPVTTDTTCAFVSPVVDDFGPGRIKNISMEGIGLHLTRRVEPGMRLAVSLSNATKRFTKTVIVRVVHTTPERGAFLVGGTFDTPLTYQELTALVM